LPSATIALRSGHRRERASHPLKHGPTQGDSMTATQTDRLPSGTAIVVAGCIILALAAGLRQMSGVFLQPVTLDLDIGRQSFGLAIEI
jgi:hypothetical protein